jgi:hypothetical protein
MTEAYLYRKTPEFHRSRTRISRILAVRIEDQKLACTDTKKTFH